MHNPLALLSPELVMSLAKHGFIAFIRQSYPRGKDHFDPDTIETFLITPYKTLAQANEHLLHISADHRKGIYHTANPEEMEKLMTAATQPKGYKVYVALLKVRKWKGTAQLQEKLKHYLQTNTKWKVKDGAIVADLYLHYGELMLKLVNPVGEIRLSLSEVEKC
ncbi:MULTISPECIES: hypothetical protein [Chitinophaga]|uniref:hypothetical protein n=1 Tax=Chitinophaga TaxID=79328 RepID=UPI000DB9E5ED|nr:hypothetical protein [Chitinophaga ginsengisegetis]MDR6570033.1 hypothetical protein [Chitinophaga ginsengisegetis]MDR6649767.1 hypothetical protein [Chitinophaga ginsengisegetis]MDR6656030.1 hypothetical protein [Chitinophaga ginsengisegetis]